MEQDVFYRPEWTCGRYDSNTHTAIFYNLIEGLVFEFTDYSADVIGVILDQTRNKPFTLSLISEETGIIEDSILPFLQELKSYSLLTDVPINENLISDYRGKVQRKRLQQAQIPIPTKEKLPFQMENAEMMYTERAGGITSVMLEMTYRCSEKCIHCYNPGATRNDEEISYRSSYDALSLEDYKRIIDELYNHGLIKVCLSGGDPFSNKDTWEIIDYLYKKEIAVDIFTNGQKIVNEIPRLAKYYPRVVGVSIYSGNPQEHDKITRVNGSWLKSMSVVKSLSEYAIPTNMKCCVMRPNLKHYFEVADLAKQYGAVPQFEVSLSDSIDGDRCVSELLRLNKQQMEIVLRDDNIPLYVGKEAPNYGGQAKIQDNPMCGAGQNSFCITPAGDVIPCCAFHLEFGNIKKTSISDILRDSEELKDWHKTTIKNAKECGDHEYCAYCNLCPGNNYSEHGDYLKAAENNCWLAKIRYGLAQKLQKGEDPLGNKTVAFKLQETPTEEADEIRRIKNKEN